MRVLIVIFVILLLTFCKNVKETTFYYSLYDKSDSLLKEKAYILNLIKVEGNEYLMRIEGLNNYKQEIKIKVDSLGISRYCDKHFILTHHFDSVENGRFCYSNPPFVHFEVYWTKKAKYIINNTPYDIICYSEISGSETFNSSYYLKGLGFICYYKSDVDKYILCDSIKGVDFDLNILRDINQRLITDTLTFERHILARAFPKYHRTKFSE
jgi:hypothetical protein